MTIDRMRTLTRVEADGAHPSILRLFWSDGREADVDFSDIAREKIFAPLGEAGMLSQASIDEWGHALHWPNGVEIGADTLWLESLTATGRDDTRAFLEWRLRHGLSLSKAAEALGLSRRQVAYYSNGDKTVPRAILLACRGWEALTAAA